MLDCIAHQSAPNPRTMLLRGIARQLTSLSGFSHTVLASGLASGAVQACAVAGSRELFKPLACLAAHYSTDAQFKVWATVLNAEGGVLRSLELGVASGGAQSY